MFAVLSTASAAVSAQNQNLTPAEERAVADAALAAASAPTGPPATLVYANRQIVELRSPLLGRSPEERVAAAHLTLDNLVKQHVTGPFQTRAIGPIVTIESDGRRILTIMPSDVNELNGETPASVAATVAERLGVALTEVTELSRPRQVLFSAAEALLATVVFVALTWLLLKVRRGVGRRFHELTERRLRDSVVGHAQFVQATRIMDYPQRLVGVLMFIVDLFLAYAWLTFSLRRFPYTRPWGESLRGFLINQFSHIGLAMLAALPGLFTVMLIVVLTRFAVRITQLLFQSIEQGQITIPWLYPETSEPTRKLMTVGLWLFGLAIAYPYVPGSESEAFKGMSVFVGLVVSLGSSGIVNQVMSGFTLTYSRALRVGDFVTVGDVEGIASLVGTLSTKIKTIKGEDVTIPNALVVSQTVINYSRFAEKGVFIPTDITIGYDVPWRQVEALLLLAAARTAGVRREPPPLVRQAALEDAYIRYTLLFCPERPADRRQTLAAVHTNILDAFNEYGVQITSPNYEADPEHPKVVPRDQWFAAPASPTPVAGAGTSGKPALKKS